MPGPRGREDPARRKAVLRIRAEIVSPEDPPPSDSDDEGPPEMVESDDEGPPEMVESDDDEELLGRPLKQKEYSALAKGLCKVVNKMCNHDCTPEKRRAGETVSPAKGDVKVLRSAKHLSNAAAKESGLPRRTRTLPC